MWNAETEGQGLELPYALNGHAKKKMYVYTLTNFCLDMLVGTSVL